MFLILNITSHITLLHSKSFTVWTSCITSDDSNKGCSSSIVWTVDESKKEKYLNKEMFRDDFNKKYLNEFGKIKELTAPVIYNLNLFSCYDYYKERVVLIEMHVKLYILSQAKG